jgi:uncharacterized SAM-binding protein YcdF (DUF218 family)/lysophospholipase L1-like esterase
MRLVVNNTTLADRVMSPLLLSDTHGPADAIVVAGAGLIGNCEGNLNALRRTILAAHLWRQGRAPIIVFTGGPPEGLSCPVGKVMADLAVELGVPVERIRIERVSRSTHENAELSAPLLHVEGIQRVLLVTDRLHMRRFSGAFAHRGFEIGRASVPVYAGHRDNVDMLFQGLREYVALAYYGGRGWLSKAPAELPARAGAGRSDVQFAVNAISGADVMQSSAEQDVRRPIVILGASYAGGWKPSSLAGHPVINKGVQGQQSFELLARFEQDVVAARPQAVIIWGFINDIFRTPRENVDAALTRAQGSSEQMIALARKNGIEPILATEVTVRPLDTWSELIGSWVGWVMGKESYQVWVNRHVGRGNEWLRATAKREGLLLLDLQPVLADSTGMRRKEFASEDGSHITPAGYAALDAYSRPILERHFAKMAQTPAGTGR